MAPVPATFVVGGDGRVKARFVDPDYRKRMTIEDLLAALRSRSSVGRGGPIGGAQEVLERRCHARGRPAMPNKYTLRRRSSPSTCIAVVAWLAGRLRREVIRKGYCGEAKN